jgi:hypothetical protein
MDIEYLYILLFPQINLEIRAVIQFFDLRGRFRANYFSEMAQAYGQCSVSLSTIRRWHLAFAAGETTLDGDLRPGISLNPSILSCM